MAKVDDYRRAIENATIHAELSPSHEVAQLWQHIRENYEYLLKLDESEQSHQDSREWIMWQGRR